MRFFRRGGSGLDEDFWTWWERARPRIERAIEGAGFDQELVDEVTRAVRAIDPRLAWEFSKGAEAGHAFTVSG